MEIGKYIAERAAKAKAAHKALIEAQYEADLYQQQQTALAEENAQLMQYHAAMMMAVQEENLV